jgi:hypothetical protein
MLTRTIQAYSCVFARAPVHPCAPATRAHNLLLAMYSQALSPGDLLSRPLSHATSPPWRAPRCFSARYTRHLDVCARARSRMRACYTRAPAVAYARSRVSKPIRVRRGGEEACFLHLYEPYVALGFVFLDSMPSERISKKIDFWIFTVTVTVTVTAASVMGLDLSVVPWRWRAASSEAFALYVIVAGCGRAPNTFRRVRISVRVVACRAKSA